MLKPLTLILPTVVLLTACDDGATSSAGGLSVAQQACLRDVTATTGNPDVVLLSTQGSEAGTLVKVGVGPNRAPWQCIGFADGTTDGIESLTDEGFL